MSGQWRVRTAMAVLGLLIVLRPGLGETGTTEVAPGEDLEIVLVVDETVSMSALDHAGVRSRLEGVKEDLHAIAKALPESRFALVTFGRKAELEMPFTSDPEAVRVGIDSIAREPLLAGTGSTMSRPLPIVRDLLARSQAQHPDRRRVLIFASDGENTSRTEKQASFAPLDPLVDVAAVLGYGTPDGARMPTGGDPPWTFVRDITRRVDAISRLDEPNLQKIASELGGDYTRRGNLESLGPWAEAVGGKGHEVGDGEAKYELYWVFALLLLGCALLELRYDVAAWREAREAVGS